MGDLATIFFANVGDLATIGKTDTVAHYALKQPTEKGHVAKCGKVLLQNVAKNALWRLKVEGSLCKMWP